MGYSGELAKSIEAAALRNGGGARAAIATLAPRTSSAAGIGSPNPAQRQRAAGCPRKGASPNRGIPHINPLRDGPPQLPLGRVLGLDPGCSFFGWGLLEAKQTTRRVASGWFTAAENVAKHGDKQTQIVRWLVELFEAHQPQHVVMELPSGNVAYRMRGLSAAAYGQAIGAARAVAIVRGVPHFCVDVKSWKGNTKKGYTAGITCHMLGYRSTGAGSEDEHDALGVALWYVMTNGGADLHLGRQLGGR